MPEDVAAWFERREPWSYIVCGLTPGLVLGFALSTFYPPFGMAAGLFGGSSLTMGLLLYLFRVRPDRGGPTPDGSTGDG